MEIKPGMYVRTKLGIKKIYDINEKATKWKYQYKLKEQDGDDTITLGSFSDDEVLGEPSYNIKDLLEPGDLIEWYIDELYFTDSGLSIVYSKGRTKRYIYDDDCELCVDDIVIDKILTREQFNHHSFNVEEDV